MAFSNAGGVLLEPSQSMRPRRTVKEQQPASLLPGHVDLDGVGEDTGEVSRSEERRQRSAQLAEPRSPRKSWAETCRSLAGGFCFLCRQATGCRESPIQGLLCGQ